MNDATQGRRGGRDRALASTRGGAREAEAVGAAGLPGVRSRCRAPLNMTVRSEVRALSAHFCPRGELASQISLSH